MAGHCRQKSIGRLIDSYTAWLSRDSPCRVTYGVCGSELDFLRTVDNGIRYSIVEDNIGFMRAFGKAEGDVERHDACGVGVVLVVREYICS